MSPYRESAKPAPEPFRFMAWIRSMPQTVQRWFNHECTHCHREIRVDRGEVEHHRSWSTGTYDGDWYYHDECLRPGYGDEG